jgi:acyl carrier protein
MAERAARVFIAINNWQGRGSPLRIGASPIRPVCGPVAQGGSAQGATPTYERRRSPLMDERAKIKAFLGKYFRNLELEDDQDFFALGFVNSLFAMQLVLFVEKELGVSVTNEDLDIKNFRSINAILRLVQQKKSSV